MCIFSGSSEVALRLCDGLPRLSGGLPVPSASHGSPFISRGLRGPSGQPPPCPYICPNQPGLTGGVLLSPGLGRRGGAADLTAAGLISAAGGVSPAAVFGHGSCGTARRRARPRVAWPAPPGTEPRVAPPRRRPLSRRKCAGSGAATHGHQFGDVAGQKCGSAGNAWERWECLCGCR